MLYEGVSFRQVACCICVAIVNMGLYTTNIGWGRWLYIVHETVFRQWFEVASVVSWVAISDYRLY